MNRRDLIIAAVLINAVLLIALFIGTFYEEDKGAVIVQSDIAQLAPCLPQNLFMGKEQNPPLYTKERQKDNIKTVLPIPLSSPELDDKQKKSEPSPHQTSALELKTITVEKGDALEKIARSHGVSVQDIIKLNRLENTRLRIGQVLKLPQKKVKQKTKQQVESDDTYYVVKAGESPWTIAQKHHMLVEDLLRLNNINEAQAKRLRPGDRLKIK